MVAAIALAMGMANFQPSQVNNMDFMSGSWVCELGERIVEERWMVPVGGSLQGSARHIVDGKVVFMEFFAIEEIEGNTSLFLHVGKLSESKGEIERFDLSSAAEGKVVFSRDVQDFPDEIIYEKVDGGLKATLSGTRNGEADSFSLNFKPKKGKE